MTSSLIIGVPHMRAAKQELRRLMETKRNEANKLLPTAAVALRDQILSTVRFPPNSIIASYHIRGSEMNPAPLTDALRTKGHAIALPVMNGKKAPLLFRKFNQGDPMAAGHFGLFEPLPDAPAVEPDIVLVPLLAFDKNKNRLGYGGGFYDRTLTFLRQFKTILTIGLAYSCQEVLEIPTNSYDARLDKVATEIKVF